MEIEIMEFFKIIFTVIVAAGGWLVTHYYTSKRNIENSRRESRIEALSQAYNALVRTALNGSLVTRKKDGTILNKAPSLENAIATIHLYGNDEQSKLASKCAEQFEKTGKDKYNDLVNSLRIDIREMLNESDLKEPPIYLRITYQDLSEEKK